VCNSTNGEDAKLTVDIKGSFIGSPSRNNVRVGSVTLACAVARLFLSGISCSADNPCPSNTGTVCVIPTGASSGTCEIIPYPSTTTSPPDQKQLEALTCYSVAVSPRNSGSPPPSYEATDNLLGTEEGVQDSGIQYICAPAALERETRQ
jgi:hypothetical protein